MDRLNEIEAYWSDQAATFDTEPDHGLADPLVRTAWNEWLGVWVGVDPVRIIDLGCGTGSLSVLLAETGHEVVGVDLSEAMVAQARKKAALAGVGVAFHVGDASDPPVQGGLFDVVLSRHLVWTLLDPLAALQRWAELLEPNGRLVLIEGRWGSADQDATAGDGLNWGAGVPAAELVNNLSRIFAQIVHYPLSDDTRLWGGQVTDERYAIVARSALT